MEKWKLMFHIDWNRLEWNLVVKKMSCTTWLKPSASPTTFHPMLHIPTGPQKHCPSLFPWALPSAGSTLPPDICTSGCFFLPEPRLHIISDSEYGGCLPIFPLLCWCSHPQLLGVLVINSSHLPPFPKNCPEPHSLRGYVLLTRRGNEASD